MFWETDAGAEYVHTRLRAIPEAELQLVAGIADILPTWPRNTSVFFANRWWADAVPDNDILLSEFTPEKIAQAEAFFLVSASLWLANKLLNVSQGKWDCASRSPLDRFHDRRIAVVKRTIGILLGINCHELTAAEQVMETTLAAMRNLTMPRENRG